MLQDAAPACPSHGRRPLGVGEERVGALGDVLGEPGGVPGAPSPALHGLEGHEKPGLAIDDHLGDATGSRCDNGRLAGHGFEVHDPEGLVDRWADEDVGVGEQLGDVLLGDLPDPDHVSALGGNALDLARHFGFELRRVGRPGAEHELCPGIDLEGGVEEVGQSLLTGDPPEVHHDRPAGIAGRRSQGPAGTRRRRCRCGPRRRGRDRRPDRS